MTAIAQIQAARADFLDPSLYDDSSLSALTHASRGTLLTGLSHAFDLAEGRKPGHAQRVAYVGIALANELSLSPEDIEDVFFACLLHDIGMASIGTRVRTEGPRAVRPVGNTVSDLVNVQSGRWPELLEAIGQHCEVGARVARKMGFRDSVARAVAGHHETWDASKDLAPLVSQVVAAADRFESMIDGESSPLMVRRKGPQMVRDMAHKEISPEIAETMVSLAARDGFWFGFYDNDLASTLMAMNFGGPLRGEDLYDFLGVLSDVVDGRNGREAGRGRRVAAMAHELAIVCDLPERRADLVRVAALLQDLGTLGVPGHVLSKPDILTIEEMAAVQLHPIYARDILSEIPGMGAASWWVGCHHERIDGKGYPGMLEGDEVPLEAQVIGLCEAYDALTSERPYRKAMTADGAMSVINGLAGTRFRADVVESFETLIASGSTD